MEVTLQRTQTEEDRWGFYWTQYDIFSNGSKIGIGAIQRRNMLPLDSEKDNYWLKYFKRGLIGTIFPKIIRGSSKSHEELENKLVDLIKEHTLPAKE